MSSNKISIVTITYNSSKVIDGYLRSILNNKKYVSELIIIENGSSDAIYTKKVCIKYSKVLPIKYILNSNVGFGRSCNLGSHTAKSDYILFLNPDTELDIGSLKILLSEAIASGADLIGGKSVNYENERHLTVVRKPNLNIGLFEFSNLGKLFNTDRGHVDFYYLDSMDVVSGKEDIEVDGLGGAFLMVKKASFNKLGGFDERFFMYLEDVDLSVRAKAQGMKIVYCPHSTIKHIGGASSESKYKIRHQAWYDSRRYFYRKHYGFCINIVVQPLYIVEEYLLKLREFFQK